MRLSTATKVAIARTLATALLKVGVPRHQRIRRRGIQFDVDLRGLDLVALPDERLEAGVRAG